MVSRDIFRFINELKGEDIEYLADRLEFRGKDPVFVKWLGDYLNKLYISSSSKVLDIGCGTGLVSRTIANLNNSPDEIIGIDQSLILTNIAKRLAIDEGLEKRMNFYLGDAQHLDFADSSFDLVTAHTLISHVESPLLVIKEASRVTKPGGYMAFFDGDYASLTFSYPDNDIAEKMDKAMINLIVNNPRIMRDFPRLLDEVDLHILEATAHVYSEITEGSFFPGFFKTYAPMVKNYGLLSNDEVEQWVDGQQDALNNGTFFASCNYYTYIVRNDISHN